MDVGCEMFDVGETFRDTLVIGFSCLLGPCELDFGYFTPETGILNP